MGNNVFTIISFFYSLILNISFHVKKRVKSTETQLFSYIIITNIINILFALVSYAVEKSHGNIMINNFFAKGVIFCFYTFSFLFNLYVLFITKYDNNNTKKLPHNIFIKIYALLAIPIFILPIHYYNDGNIIYSYGPCANYEYIIISLMICYWFVLMIKNYQNLKRKKSIPIIAFVILLVIVAIIQKTNPQLLLLTSLETIVIYLMYFTIENPDMKLLEEVHKSKEISDTANEEKTMFLYNMTQEIRQRTDEINNSANEILDSNSIEENKDSARNIIATTSKFTSMTNEILDVSQVDSETIKTYNSKYDIKNTLKQIVNIYNEECKKKMLEFRTNIDHDIPESLYGDSISLKESLNKILKNSINNTSTGYIELNVNTIIKNDICRLIITIEDSGNGIRSEELNTIKKDNKLLSEANSLIGVMQGTLLISSDYGLGTKVKVILDQKIVETENKEVTKYVNTLDNVNVLVCDTESGLKVISKLLDGSNIKLDKVDNGKELLESIKENKYDLVLMDESTSTNNQILVSKIKSIRNFNSEVILLTRDNSYEYNEEYKNLGFDDYILKPLKKDILLDKINKYKDN